MARFTLQRHALTLALVAALGLAACEAGTAAPTASTPAASATAASATADVHALLTTARAALRQHDTRTFHEVRARLVDRLGAATVRQADAAYGRIRDDLAAAGAAHDARARARYAAALRALCDRDALVGAIEQCEGDLAALGGR